MEGWEYAIQEWKKQYEAETDFEKRVHLAQHIAITYGAQGFAEEYRDWYTKPTYERLKALQARQ